MKKNLVLISNLNYSLPEVEPIFLGAELGDTPNILTLTNLIISKYRIVTIDSVFLVEYCRKKGLDIPSDVIDVYQIFKLCIGKPVKLQEYLEAKRYWIAFSKYVKYPDVFRSVLKSINLNSIELKKSDSVSSLISFYYILQDLFLDLWDELSRKDEVGRYLAIEKPFNELLSRRQYEGIYIDRGTLNARLDEMESRCNLLSKKLRFDYGIHNPLDRIQVAKYLSDNDFPYLARTKSIGSFWSFIKAGAEKNIAINLIYQSYRLNFSYQSLMKIVVESCGKIYPTFDCSGTVTSRTIIRSPHLQYIKREYRDIIAPKEGFKLIYADYAQFEPGILASLSNDESLIQSYNEGDLYLSLSHKLFKSAENRSLCKIIFLSYLYGMSKESLHRLVNDIYKGEIQYSEDDLTAFLSNFKQLVPYRDSMHRTASSDQKIGSCFGNFRYLDNKGEGILTNKEKRWILSQKIQGTASLILKKAILDSTEDSEIQFLIPMHDAALFQVPIEKEIEKMKIIKDKFEKALAEYCKGIVPKVHFKAFTD